MHKKLSTLVVSLGLAGAAVGVGSMVNAQETDDTTDDTVVDDTTDDTRTEDVDEPADDPFVDDSDSTVDAAEDGDGEGRRGRRGGRNGVSSDTVIEALGITEDEYDASRDAGLTITEIAEQEGVAIDTVVAALVADVEEHLAEHVADGDLTEDEAAEKLVSATERIEDKVDSVRGEGCDDADEADGTDEEADTDA